MKTATQELIEIINKHADTYKGKEELRAKKAYRDIVCAIDDFRLLEKEKQQIIDAYNDGGEKGFNEFGENAEQYYNETFKQWD